MIFFFFSSRRRHTRFDCDWSSDVCSSDLDGATFIGRLLNQDTFTVQILDAKDEKLKSFSKSNLREYAFANNSSMPSYKDKLSTQELSDLISYLTSLKGQAN